MMNILYFPYFTHVKAGLSLALIGLLCLFSAVTVADEYNFSNTNKKTGYYVESQSDQQLVVSYSINKFSLSDIDIKGETFQNIELAGNFLPADEGSPNLPASGRYIAIPQGAGISMNITSISTETIEDVHIAPSFRIPKATEKGPLEYYKNETIYSQNKFFPEVSIELSEPDVIRGVDVVMLGITPFQYNPVTKQLIVYHEIKVEISFDGGSGQFGDDRLRSRWWDPIFSDILLNYNSLPKTDYNHTIQLTDDTGCDYLIITPNDMEFQQYADTIKAFRTAQGIITQVVTLAEIGGNSATLIEDYIDDAYATWDIVPSACLLLGDYGTDAANRITSPVWDTYCVSDNIFGDVTGNDLPDITMARITALDEFMLQVMVSKFVDYETAPPLESSFYNHPITTLGWQTESWFQLTAEIIGGFWREELGKNPVRINDIVSGTPGTVWSTAENTDAIVDYFGPDGLGYIPATPDVLGGWEGGTGDSITVAINDGAFMIQHRDHGSEIGWGTPAYTIASMNNLTNTELTFVWSTDCLTGKFNFGTEVFAEKFHRYTHKDENSGCFGINAASEINYSFVNDVYVLGAYDYMWPDFMPDNVITPEPRGILPAFAAVAGKYFLAPSSWPSLSEYKVATYHLYHHHGDAFTTVFSEVPQTLTVSHIPYLYMGETTFEVTADEGALIGLSVNGELIGTGTGTGSPVSITIPPQTPPDQVMVIVTKQNYFRYEGFASVLPSTGPYVVQSSISLNDATGNGNGIMETSESILASLTVENIGVEDASNIDVKLTSVDPYVNVTDSMENYGAIPAGTTAVVADAFAWNVADNIPDLHNVLFEMSATDGTSTWVSDLTITGHAPNLELGAMFMDDYIGNANGRLDPGETAYMIIQTINSGSYVASNTTGTVTCLSEYITLNNSSFNFYDIGAGLMEEAMFNVTVADNAPAGTYVEFLYEVTSGGYNLIQNFPTILSMVVEDWETGDMSMFNWTTGGEVGWDVSTQSPYEGGFCAKSGTVDHDQTSFISIEYEVFGSDTLSFWTRVSSESGYDYLKFYMNDVEISSWTGETEWTRSAFLIDEGVHTFKWAYEKDESLSSGNDCAWLDFIIFPVAVYEASFISDETEICEGASVTFTDQSPVTTISWDWTFEGGTPNTSTQQNPVVEYSSAGIFDVSLTISNGSETNTLLMEDYISVITAPGQAPVPTGLTTVCANESFTTYSTSGIPGITDYEWLLEPAEAGNVTPSGLNADVFWTDGYTGDVTLKVAGENNCGTGIYSDALEITLYLPEVTLEPFEWVCVDWPAFELSGGLPEDGEYSGPGIENGWFTPSVAGIGTHTITYTYTDPDGCENFATETILVDPCVGIDEMIDQTGISVFPNPNNGEFVVHFDHDLGFADIEVINTKNIVVYTERKKDISGKQLTMDLKGLSNGIYFIRIKTGKTEKLAKIILNN